MSSKALAEQQSQQVGEEKTEKPEKMEQCEAKKEEEEDEEEDDEDYYDDDHNNNYICESDDDGVCDSGGGDDVEADDPYVTDPEYFDYECLPLAKIDSITESKCRRLVDALQLEDTLDAVYLLKQFKWNCARILEMYSKDKQEFVSKYFSDDNNNNSSKKSTLSSGADKTRLNSYLNIFSNQTQTVSCTNSPTPSILDFCQICYQGVENDTNNENASSNSNRMLSLKECGHEFCMDCWRTHFEAILNSACGTSYAFECMQTKCKSVAPKDFVLQCLTRSECDEDESSPAYKYRVWVAIDLVKESEDLQLCPGEKEVVISTASSNTPQSTPRAITSNTPHPSSSNNIRLVSTITSTPTISFSYVRKPVTTVSSSSSVSSSFSQSSMSTPTSTPSSRDSTVLAKKGATKKCSYIVWSKRNPAARKVVCTSCNTQYCFKCQLAYHAPNSCETIRQWNIKCQDDSETRNYLLVHTQDCPKCKVCIEKNGGCSHMTCNRCKHEFCWVCGNDWKTHGATYDCNRYKGNPEQDNAREALNRYTHYYHRWINHANSLKFEKALREQCALKVHEKIMSRCGGGTLVDWEFLTEAVEILTRARYTLQYTYPYAYYLNGENNEDTLLFENIQAELEREVENLSHSLEKVSLNDKYNIRIQMSIVEKRRKTLLKDFIK